jgi:HAD superfamily hydrolase (TIGR01509 family)
VKPLRAVLFDWDGTLLDSAEASYRVYVRLFRSFGIEFTRVDFERTYSPDWYRTFEGVKLPREQWDEADARWVAMYREEPGGLLPGAGETLRRLRDAGLLRGLVSSGSRERVLGDLVRLGMDGCFDAIVCGGDTPNRKPHPEPLHAALERLRVAAQEAAYVGDSPEDVRMAQAAGVYVVGIPGGFPNRAALVAAAPDLLAPDLDAALPPLLARARWGR